MGHRRLLLGPVGPGSTFSALDFAVEASRAGQRCALVLPSRAARDHARNELARREGRCDPGSVYTFAGLANALVRRRGVRVASARERDAALAAALTGLAEPEHDLALQFRGFRQSLLRVFQEVEHNGLSPGVLAGVLRRARVPEPRAERLTRAYEGYRQHLRRRRWVSEADACRQAAQALARGQVTHTPQRVVFDGFTDFSPRQLDLINALALAAEETIVVWPCAEGAETNAAFVGAARVRAQLVRLGFAEEQRPTSGVRDPRPPALRALAAGLFCPAPTPSATADGLRVIEAASRDDEVALALHAARDFVLAEAGRRWTDVLVIAPNLRAYRAALERCGASLGVPVRVRGGLALTDAPLAQGALALVRAATTCEVRPLLTAAACPALGLSPEEADRLASAARAEGLPTLDHEASWESLAGELGGAAGTLVREALHLARGLAGLAEPSSRQGCRLVLRAWERLLRPASLGLLGSSPGLQALRAAREEVAARRELLALAADLARLDVPLPPGSDLGLSLLTRLEEEVRATVIQPKDPRRNVLHVVDPLEASAWEADLVLVLGLSDRQFPRAGGDELYLPEGARRSLTGARSRGISSLHLSTAEDRLGAERFLFYAAATRARRELWLLYPGCSPTGATQEPSRFLAAAGACFTPAAWAHACTRRSLTDAIGAEPGSTRVGLRRFAYRHVSSAAQPSGASAARAALARALFARLLEEPSERDRATQALAWVGQDRLTGEDPRAALDHVYSSSELEAFAACPFRHFVHYRLRARPADDLASSGLDARRQGTVVHEALQRVYAAGLDPHDALREAFTHGARELEIGLEEDTFFRRASEAVLHFVRDDDPAFLRATELEPWGFERAFGPGTVAGPLEVDVPELEGKAVLRGAIDRVDVVALEGDPSRLGAFVTDYKLGAREVDSDYLNAMHQGDRVQLPLYLLAIQRVFGLEPLGAAFAALGARRRTGVIDPSQAARAADLPSERFTLYPVALERTLERTEGHVRRTVRAVAEGWVAARPREAKECDTCSARDACRLTPGEQRRRARNGRPLPLGQA
ncbi:MAG: PD-(D/E)XK nuclease family protein [Planctomycetes bacterium]|nr:PD-(D/E)XK nuclease family protein [Planctomycetota bacterium]